MCPRTENEQNEKFKVFHILILIFLEILEFWFLQHNKEYVFLFKIKIKNLFTILVALHLGPKTN